MPSVTIADIDERVRHLPPNTLIVVDDVVSYVLERDLAKILLDADSDARATMLASERESEAARGDAAIPCQEAPAKPRRVSAPPRKTLRLCAFASKQPAFWQGMGARRRERRLLHIGRHIHKIRIEAINSEAKIYILMISLQLHLI
ncbi:hypothetical protein [Candidatus Chloroploca sp. Khr17]|uniref:hypothetical protein n=1 Tax=Candidatus Chloroploca sp. Khr17 TaxID=2496869 RepID=UPI00101C2E77|nr:hypothetical protein [Candidatus Chloroploca sp. Khr17]